MNASADAAITLADVVAALERLYPPSTAQSWDRVGLVTGDPSQEIRRIHLAVDPTLAVIAEARDAGADLLITHHPLLLRGVHSLATTSGKGAAVTDLIVADIALYCAHTNADVAEGGVCDALAGALGLSDIEPMAQEEGQPMGRVGRLPTPTTLGAFADQLYAVLPPAPGGIRVAGPADAPVERVAVLGGAGDSLFDEARASGADVYVTADLRHHPVLELREETKGGPPYAVDAGHWATESLWLPAVEEALLTSLAQQRGSSVEELRSRVETHISTVRTDPWEFTVGARGHQESSR